MFAKFFTWTASIFTVLGVSIGSFFADGTKAIIALVVFTISMSIITWCAYRFLKTQLNRRYKEGFLPIASSIRYSTSDGKNYVYDQFRHIQVKRPYMTAFEHKFRWTGSRTPAVSSDLQVVGETKPYDMDDGSKGNVIAFKFASTRIYNDAEVIHIKMEIDDSDCASQPRISQKVEEPIRLISWRVELINTNKTYFKNKATLTRQNIEKSQQPPDLLKNVDFDQTTKSYSVNLPNPEPGYIYTLEWIRPGQKKQSGN